MFTLKKKQKVHPELNELLLSSHGMCTVERINHAIPAESLLIKSANKSIGNYENTESF